jgi:hypothetical protein
MRKGTMTKISLVTAAALAAAAALAIRTRVAASSPTAASAIGAAGRSGPGIGRQRRWAVALETKLQEGGAAASRNGNTTVLTGDWIVTVVGVSPAGYDLACEIQNAHVTGAGGGPVDARDLAQLEQNLGRRFWVSYQADGAARQLHFPRDMTDDVRNFLALLVTQTEMVRPLQPSAQWTATERDGAGAYFAAYEQPGSKQIIKRKLRYVSVDGAATASAASIGVRVVHAEARFTLDDQNLVTEVEDREVAALDPKMGAPALAVEIELHLDRARSGIVPELIGSLERARPGLETGPVVTQRAPADELQARSDARLVRDLTMAQILATVGGGQADDRTRVQLEALFRRRPADIPAAAAFARQASPSATRMVLQALGVAGTEPAQGALCAVADDPQAPTPLRVVALGAFIQTKRPTETTISTITRLMDAQDPAVRRQALYMAGSLGSNSQGDEPAAAARIETELLGRYATCAGSACLDLLAALGNLATPRVLPPIARALNDLHADVRASAVRALRKVKDPSVDRLISTTMIGDHDPNVRAAAILAATFRPIGAFIEPLARTVRTDPVDYVRSAAINSVASHVDGSPLIEHALMAAATDDVKPGVRRLARQALGPRAAGLRDR